MERASEGLPSSNASCPVIASTASTESCHSALNRAKIAQRRASSGALIVGGHGPGPPCLFRSYNIIALSTSHLYAEKINSSPTRMEWLPCGIRNLIS
jgi:hypothetical protein